MPPRAGLQQAGRRGRISGRVVATCACALGCSLAAAACGSSSTTKATTRPAPATKRPQITGWTLPPVTGGLIRHQPGALRVGRRVASASLDIRSFENRLHGWALADVNSTQYPAFTADGGATWRIAGPPLHRDAAQGAIGVGQIGVPSRRSGWTSNTTAFAWGGVSPDSVVDVTLDGGRHWWGAMLPGSVLFVSNEGHELVANVYGTAKKGGVTRTGVWAFATRTGRRWAYIAALYTP